uniref:Ig-like domain-containing protein n=1 Tax=Poecilia formosa TaxID=48698 RepID=A0A087XSQ0_POEFO
VTLKPNWPHIFSGETVTLTCEIRGGGETQWTYEWRTNDQNSPTSSEYRINDVTESDSGEYSCRGRGNHQFTQWSDNYSLTVLVSSTASVTLQHSWSPIYRGETVTLRCEIQKDEGPQWTYYWSINSEDPTPSNEYRINTSTMAYSGEYQCSGRRDHQLTEWSGTFRLPALSDSILVTLKPNWPHIFSGETVTLTCEIRGGGETQWTYEWRTNDQNSPTSSEYRINDVTESDSGEYSCRGRGNHQFTQWSDNYSLTVSVSIKPTITWKHNWPQIFRGEKITLRCEIRGGTQWTYEWRTNNRNSPTSSEYKIIAGNRDTFSCRGKGNYQFTQWSDDLSLTVSTKPAAKLTASDTILSAGGSVTLTCSVSGSAGWKFDLLRRQSKSHRDQTIRTNKPDGVFIVSDEGVYSCRGGRGGRGDPVFYTETSNEVTLWKT